MPADDVVGQRRELGADRGRRAIEQPRDLARA
jgi:hypothetical protein